MSFQNHVKLPLVNTANHRGIKGWGPAAKTHQRHRGRFTHSHLVTSPYTFSGQSAAGLVKLSNHHCRISRFDKLPPQSRLAISTNHIILHRIQDNLHLEIHGSMKRQIISTKRLIFKNTRALTDSSTPARQRLPSGAAGGGSGGLRVRGI